MIDKIIMLLIALDILLVALNLFKSQGAKKALKAAYLLRASPYTYIIYDFLLIVNPLTSLLYTSLANSIVHFAKSTPATPAHIVYALALNGNAHNCNEKLNVSVVSCSTLASLVPLLACKKKVCRLRQTLNKHEDIKRESIRYFYPIFKTCSLSHNLFVT